METQLKAIIGLASKSSKESIKSNSYAELQKGLSTIKKVEEAEKSLVRVEKERIKAEQEVQEKVKKTIQVSEEDLKAKIKLQLAEKERRASITAAVKLEEGLEGSYNKLNAQFTINEAKLKKMSKAERENTDAGKALEKETNAIYQEMKRLSESMGKNQLNVGNYEKVTKSLRQQLKETKNDLTALIQAGGKMSDEKVKQLAKQYNDLSDTMKKAKNAAELSDVSGKITAVAKTVSTLAAGYEVAQGAAALFGIENEDLQKQFVKLQAVMAIANGLETIANSLKEESIVVTFAQSVASGVATAAQWLWNAAMSANPIGLIITAVAAMGAALYGLSKMMGTVTSRQEYYNKLGKIAKEYTDENKKAIDSMKDALFDLGIELDVASGKMDEYTAAQKRNKKEAAGSSKEADAALLAAALKTDKLKNEEIAKINEEAETKKENLYIKYFDSETNQSYVTAEMLAEIETWKGQEIAKVVKANLLANTKITKEHLLLEAAIKEVQGRKDSLILTKKYKDNEEKYKTYLEKLDELTRKHRDAHTSLLIEGQKKEEEVLTNSYKDELAEIDKMLITLADKNKAKKDAKEIYDAQMSSITKKYLDQTSQMEQENYLAGLDARDKEVVALQLAYEKKRDLAIESGADYENITKEYLDAVTAIDKKYTDKGIEDAKTKAAKLDVIRKAKLKKEAEDREKGLQAIEDIEKYFAEKKQTRLDNEIKTSQKQQDLLRKHAANGVEDAKKNLAFEELNEIKLQQRKEKELRKAKQMEMTISILKAYSKNLENQGGSSTKALTDTMRDTIILQNFIKSLPTLFKGTEDTGDGSSLDDKGGMLSVLHPHERVMTAEQNNLVNGLTNWELANAGLLYKKQMNSKIESDRFMSNEKVLEKFDELKEEIRNKPVYMGNEYLKDSHSIVEMIEQGTSLVRNHKTLSKLG